MNPEVQLNTLRQRLQRTRNTVNPIRIARRATRTARQLSAIAFKNRGMRYRSDLPTQREGFAAPAMPGGQMPPPVAPPVAPPAQPSMPGGQMPPPMPPPVQQHPMPRPPPPASGGYHRPPHREPPTVIRNYYNTYGYGGGYGGYGGYFGMPYTYYPRYLPIGIPTAVQTVQPEQKEPEEQGFYVSKEVALILFIVFILGLFLLKK